MISYDFLLYNTYLYHYVLTQEFPDLYIYQNTSKILKFQFLNNICRHTYVAMHVDV